MNLTLINKRPEAENTVSFIFQPGSPVHWIAGQYLELSVPHENPDSHGTKHYFTIASAPYEKVIQITTRLSGSTFKDTLSSLPLGSVLTASGPEGDFTLENPTGEYVFIAGGIGITPFRSILKQLDHEGKKIKVNLLYGNRTSDVVFKRELEQLSKSNPDFRILYLISPERIDAQSIRANVPNLSVPMFYISGPEPMVESLETTFQNELGVPDERMKRDYFPGYDQHNF